MTPGYFQSTYWPDLYFAEDYWPDYGSHILAAASGSFSVSGTAVGLLYHRHLSCAAGSITLSLRPSVLYLAAAGLNIVVSSTGVILRDHFPGSATRYVNGAMETRILTPQGRSAMDIRISNRNVSSIPSRSTISSIA
jgi:hypothetical protein